VGFCGVCKLNIPTLLDTNDAIPPLQDIIVTLADALCTKSGWSIRIQILDDCQLYRYKCTLSVKTELAATLLYKLTLCHLVILILFVKDPRPIAPSR